MDLDVILGTGITVVAVLSVVGLYVWSYRIIERIHRNGLTSLRQIRKDLKHGSRAE